MDRRQRLCLVDWMLVPLFAGSAFTGIGLHIAGHGGETGMVWHAWTIAHIVVCLVFTAFVVWHIQMHWSWYKSLFRGPRGKKSLVTILISVLFMALAITGVLLFAVWGANSLPGLWHYRIGLLATLLFAGHVVKRWRVLKQLRMKK